MKRGFARQRDANEKEIVATLVAVGATVTRLDALEPGCPDLLVGYQGETFLLEVKQQTATGRARRRGAEADARGLSETQQKWWRTWTGSSPVVVTSPTEALAAIGFPRISTSG